VHARGCVCVLLVLVDCEQDDDLLRFDAACVNVEELYVAGIDVEEHLDVVGLHVDTDLCRRLLPGAVWCCYVHFIHWLQSARLVPVSL
jgi:hypothetical protein